jgi:hypothetical protein
MKAVILVAGRAPGIRSVHGEHPRLIEADNITILTISSRLYLWPESTTWQLWSATKRDRS